MVVPQQSAPAPVRAGGVTQRSDPLSTPDCTPSTTFIYALLDSRTGCVRYVGKSDCPDHRMRAHCHARGRGHKQSWLRQLKREGLWPVLQILEECSCECWQERERYWIAFYRKAGEPLTNLTDGGEGFAWYVYTDEARAAQSKRMKAILADPELRARIAESSKKLWDDPEFCAMREAIRTDPACRAKLSASSRKRWEDPEMRTQVSVAQRKRFAEQGVSSVTKAKLTEANKRRWAKMTPEERSEIAHKVWVTRRANAARKAADAG